MEQCCRARYWIDKGDEVTSLEPAQLWLLRIHALIGAMVIGVGALVAERTFVEALELPRGVVFAPALVVILYSLLLSPGRHYRAWGYAMDSDELQIEHGVWIKMHTIVPLDRVQHIDVSQGPLERPLGLCRLIVHTAGTQHSRVVLPGLSRPNAERMRDEIRLRIRRESE